VNICVIKLLKHNNIQPSAWLVHGGFLRANNCNVFEKKFIKEYFSQQKKQALQKLTQSLNSAAVRCLCKY